MYTAEDLGTVRMFRGGRRLTAVGGWGGWKNYILADGLGCGEGKIVKLFLIEHLLKQGTMYNDSLLPRGHDKEMTKTPGCFTKKQ